MLGRLDFNKKNKIYINQEGLINGLRVRSGFDKNLQKIDPKVQETYFNQPSDYKSKDNVITIFGDESLDELLNFVLQNKDKSKHVLGLICLSLNDLFPEKTRKLFEKIRLENPEIYQSFKKSNLNLLTKVGNVKGVIQEELEREGLWEHTNFIIRIITRIKYLLSNKK
jgi:hypothetical protein